MRGLILVLLGAMACGGSSNFDAAGTYEVQIGVPGCIGIMTLTKVRDGIGGQWVCGNFGAGDAFGTIDKSGAVAMDLVVPIFEPLHLVGTFDAHTGQITGVLNDGFDIKDMPFLAIR